tara:strand:+ start:338 stop:481 length:144 start_codon:yes stop_codon:yes gene_type:complete
MKALIKINKKPSKVISKNAENTRTIKKKIIYDFLILLINEVSLISCL